MQTFSEAEFTYPTRYSGQGKCELQVFEFSERIVVVATNNADYHTISVTNSVEDLATVVYRQYAFTHFVEHYPARPYGEETFDFVTFTYNDKTGHFSAPEWTPGTRAQVEALIGRPYARAEG